MCDSVRDDSGSGTMFKTIPVKDAVGMVLAHDITEIRKGEFKGRAFKKGHVVNEADISHLQRLGKEHLYVLEIGQDDMHENEAAYALADALCGDGVKIGSEPVEGKINLLAARDGLLKINVDALKAFNMLGEVICATIHSNTVVKEGQIIGSTRAIPLVVKRKVIKEAVAIAAQMRNTESGVTPSLTLPPPRSCSAKRGRRGGGQGWGILEVKEIRRPKAGVVITGNEVYHGRIKDAFAPLIAKKIIDLGGEIVATYYAPDDVSYIEARMRELIQSGADLLITTGGMSVDPDDVTRFAIRNLGATDITYGSAVLPGAMFLVAYLYQHGHGDKETRRHGEAQKKVNKNDVTVSPFHRNTASSIPILGIPACGMYHKITIFDLILPRILAGEIIGRKELAELGHGGLCLNCRECRYPVCPFGKGS